MSVAHSNKRAKHDHESVEEAPLWLPEGCTVVIAKVYSPKHKTAKFAFPSDLVYKNLASLLGFIANPWSERHPCERQGKNIVEADGEILRDLCVTPEMCQGYVEFRRFGSKSDEAVAFLIRAAAPKDLVDRYQYEADKASLEETITVLVKDLGGVWYSEQRDDVGLFAKWDSWGEGHIEICVNGGKDHKQVILHKDNAEITALRQKICRKIWKLPLVRKARTSAMGAAVLTIMRDQTLPFYKVPLLCENETESFFQ